VNHYRELSSLSNELTFPPLLFYSLLRVQLVTFPLLLSSQLPVAQFPVSGKARLFVPVQAAEPPTLFSPPIQAAGVLPPRLFASPLPIFKTKLFAIGEIARTRQASANNVE